MNHLLYMNTATQYEHQDTTNDQNMIHHDTNYVYKLRININMVDILKTKLLMITFFI